MSTPPEMKAADLLNFTVISVQLSQRLSDGSSRHTMTHTMGLYTTEREAVGAAILYARETEPGFSIDQWIVTRPFDPAEDEDEDEEYFDEGEEDS